MANNPTVFIDDADMKKMAVSAALTNDIRRNTMTRLHSSFKTDL